MQGLLGRYAEPIYAVTRIVAGMMYWMHGTTKWFDWPPGARARGAVELASLLGVSAGHGGRPSLRAGSKAWREACKQAGIQRIPHDFRRTAVRNLERAGVPRTTAMALIGHKTEPICRRYSIVGAHCCVTKTTNSLPLHRPYRSQRTSG